MRNNELQIVMWANDGSELLYAFPHHALPIDPAEAMMGPLIAKWFATNGEAGHGAARRRNMLARRSICSSQASGQKEEESDKTAQEIWKILAEETYSASARSALSPAVMGVRIVKNNVGNIPARQINGQHGRTPARSHPATLYFKSGG